MDADSEARIAKALESHGIPTLYPPQKEAWEAIQTGRNVVVSIPTASGKSLVAYLALMRNHLLHGRKGMFIVPLRALASEKYEELTSFRAQVDWNVGISTGDLDENDPRLGRNDVIVCTSEKADSLLRHRTGWVQEIGCIIIDEVHLLHDPSRGPTLEVILSRFRSLFPHVQIIALSATVQNAKDMAGWLDAELITSTWRPVELRKATFFGNALDVLDVGVEAVGGEGSPIARLVEDALEKGGQSLVFVNSRRSAEAEAQRLATTVRKHLKPAELEAIETRIQESFGLEEDRDGPLHKKLLKLARAGVAFHTAGLDSKQRRFVEHAFRAREIKALCATPTLAAGVNTPARRVIIRDVTRFENGRNAYLPVMEVHQMMGRAGRPRYDPYGEAVLLAKDEEKVELLRETYLRGDVEAVESKLGAAASLRVHILATVSGGYCDSRASILDFLEATFWGQTTDRWIIEEQAGEALDFLVEEEFLVEQGEHLETTLLGKRTSDLYIDPMSALRMKESFESKHPPTPFGFLAVVAGAPDTFALYLRAADGWVKQEVVERWSEILNRQDLQLDEEELSAIVKSALLYHDWIEEVPMQSLEERYGIGPGDVRTKVDTAKWLCHAYRELARALHPDWVKPLTDLTLRLEHGVRQELLGLLKLRGVGRLRARALFQAGIRSVADLRKVEPQRLVQVPGIGTILARRLLEEVGRDHQDVEAEPSAPGGQMSLGDWR